MTFDYIVVGAGLAGCTVAERLAEAGKHVLIVEKRNHIGGNCFDYYNEYGVLVHKYGPHIFHTNSEEVFRYLSRFTEWRIYEHRVLASVDGQLVPFPINADTLNQLSIKRCVVGRNYAHPHNAREALYGSVGPELTEKFFAGYSRKQWGLELDQLDPSVVSRVPVRTNRDPRYFADRYQGLPCYGYTRMFEKMLESPNITIMLQSDFSRTDCPALEVADDKTTIVYTGPVDEFFNYRLGKLPYRSATFEFTTKAMPIGQHCQPAAVINYPNDYDFTRIAEFRQMTGQQVPFTTVAIETPQAEGEPLYPVPTSASAALSLAYKGLADQAHRVEFVGRLGTFSYLNMDQVVAQALGVVRRILAKEQAT